MPPRSLSLPSGLGGHTFWLTGPELLSYGDAAAILTDIVGHPIAFQARTEDQDREAMLATGVPEPVAVDNARAFSLIGKGDAD